MSGNSDILMGYFDSLLTTVDEVDAKKAIVSELLAGSLYVAEEAAPVQLVESEVCLHPTDTIAVGRRMTTLFAPRQSGDKTTDRIMALELLRVAGELEPGRVKQTVLKCCAGVLNA
ncbi:hypothetical protein [Thalassolituus sp.]|uniref:hypothetical protein n=1 Tax=Thalassolituus sp. TaxID=2030822 RepID=UPI003511240B